MIASTVATISTIQPITWLNLIDNPAEGIGALISILALLIMWIVWRINK